MKSIIVTDEMLNIVMVNYAFSRMTRYKPSEVIGHRLSILDAGIHRYSFYRQIKKSVQRHGRWRGQAWVRKKNGEINLFELDISTMLNTGRNKHFIGVLKLADEEKDPLTGLWKRETLEQDLKLQLMKDRKSLPAVLFIDIDQFKRYNSALGPQKSDMILKAIAKRLKSILPQNCKVARLAGDGFIALIPHAGSERQVREVAEHISDCLSQAIPLNDLDIYIKCSIGFSMYPQDGANADELMQNALSAMYYAKEAGRDSIQRYNRIMRPSHLITSSRVQLENDLRYALERNELHLMYQPLYDRHQHVIAYEALIRWQHPEKGNIPPSIFIPIAEQSDLILDINEWVLRTACHQNRQWQREGKKPMPIAVNLSAILFEQKDLATKIDQILTESQLHPSYLHLELTENIFIYDTEQTLEVLHQLQEQGLSISLDDFGMGFSSLNYIKRFPLDMLKIDKTFVQDVARSSKDQAIVKTIIELAHSLNIKVVAEGVETIEQFHYLNEQECDYFQGYLLGRPMPPESVNA